MSKDSGQLNIIADEIRYNSETYGNWSIPISEVKAIGEYTNDQGPFLDDWFLLFFLKDCTWYEASNYSENITEFKNEIQSKLNIENVYSDLSGSTDYNSYIIWPNSLNGKKAFEFKNFYSSWWRKLILSPSIKFNLSKELCNYLQKA